MDKSIDTIKIAVYTEDNNLKDKAQTLANKLSLDLISENKLDCYDYILRLTYSKLEIASKKYNISAVHIDFSYGKNITRVKTSSGFKEPLAKAVGIKSGNSLTVLDATAGFAKDSFLLASLGCKMILLERSDIMACLLEDAINRSGIDFEFYHTDAIEYLQKLNKENYPDVIYLDPMFPAKQKKALVKKEMQFLQKLLAGEETDNLAVLNLACKRAKKRVVVKRPKSAPTLGIEPSMVIKGKQYRYDVYLLQCS